MEALDVKPPNMVNPGSSSKMLLLCQSDSPVCGHHHVSKGHIAALAAHQDLCPIGVENHAAPIAPTQI